jgi:hypothetical protein
VSQNPRRHRWPALPPNAGLVTTTALPFRPRSLPWPCEQPASARWGGAQASRRPAQGADRQPHGPRCLEEHHASGPQRVHLLGRGCQAGDDPRTPHSPDPGGARRRPASALLLARMQAPRAHRQIAVGWVPLSPARRRARNGHALAGRWFRRVLIGPPARACSGEVVKQICDAFMIVFADANSALRPRSLSRPEPVPRRDPVTAPNTTEMHLGGLRRVVDVRGD